MRLRAPSPLLLLLALLAGSPQPAEGQEPPPPPAEVVAPLPALPAPPPSGPRPPGMVLAEAPSAAPGRVAPEVTDPLSLGRERYAEGDLAGTIAALTPWLEGRKGPHGRSRSAGHLLLGMAHFGLENWNLASHHFYQVRRTGGPLAPYGAWNEALVDHRRGRHRVAARECSSYRNSWPDGPHADECLLLMGDAYAADGARSASLGAYGQYLEHHPDTPRKEEIQLATALAYARTDPKRGIALLQALGLDHSYPSTDLAVQAELAALREAGHPEALLPTDPPSLMRRTASLRRSGLHEDAWALFNELARLGEANPEVARWIEDNEERMAWGTRNYDVYAEALSAQYEAAPDPDQAWSIFVAWSRAGEWAKATEWGRKGLDAHKSHWRWKAAKDDMAWATLLAGQYKEAQERWSALSKGGGDFGRKAAFYAAFAAYRGGDFETAEAGFGALTERRTDWTAPAHYWRAKVHAAKGDDTAAENDRQMARVTDSDGWYGLLLDNAARPPTGDFNGWRERDGRWHGPAAPSLPPLVRPGVQALAQTGLGGHALDTRLDQALEASPFAGLRWEQLQAPTGAPVDPAALSPGPALPQSGLALPDGYPACSWYDRDAAARDFLRFSEAHKALWPGLPAAYDLAMAGLYTDAARELFDNYEEWRSVVQDGAKGDPRRQQIASLGLRLTDWRPFLLLVRDHYHAARACWGLEKSASDETERIAALRLGYPLVRPDLVWQTARRYNVDPYLIYGIMRQESTYRNAALSPVGAIGLIQVMPATGAKVAALLGEHRYSPGMLEDPKTNLRYGIYYFSRLLDRFDGVFPLAVASYNGGPHNMSRWYRPWTDKKAGDGIDLDALVETIQYDETRDYVKRVSGHYMRYIEIYEGADARVVLPLRPAGDDASVIDF